MAALYALAARRDGQGPWPGLVSCYDPTVALGWYQWRPADQLRPAQTADSVLEDGNV